MPDLNTYNMAAELGPIKDAVGAASVTVSTTAALTAVGNAINTTGKYKGKQVLNDTTHMVVVANGPLAADLWYNVGTGAATTPV